MTRKCKTDYATRGSLTAEGATRAEAKEKLAKLVDWASPVIETTRSGATIVVTATANGWQYTIIDTTGHIGGTCMMGQIERDEALDRARHHVAQNAWTLACIDDTAFVAGTNLPPNTARELAEWITWQRRYAAHKAVGMTDNEAWTAAAA